MCFRLVDMVKGVTPSTQRELCCSHRAFKVGKLRGRLVSSIIILFCPGLRASRDPGVRGQRADERPGLRPGDARQEPWLPPQAVSGNRGNFNSFRKKTSSQILFRTTCRAGLTALGTTFHWRKRPDRWTLAWTATTTTPAVRGGRLMVS